MQIKFDYVSDLHLDSWINLRQNVRIYKEQYSEYLERFFPEKRNDTLVIAGDISHYNNQTVPFLSDISKEYKNILFVAGNHDYYIDPSTNDYVSSKDRINKLKERVARINNVHFLDRTNIVIDGVSYSGCTGWYDNSYAYKVLGVSQQKLLSEFNRFPDSHYMYKNKRINYTIQDMEKLCLECMQFFMENKYNTNVFITHHIPLWRYIRDIFKYSAMSSFYYFDSKDVLDGIENTIWVYGHTHDEFKYENDGNYFLCNPVGYNHERNNSQKFVKNFVFDY
jgi:predicted phosphodiesterase